MLAPEDLDELVTTAGAAERAGVAQHLIRQWASRGIAGYGKLEKKGLDLSGRPMYRTIDVLRAERASRQHAQRSRSKRSLQPA